MAYVRQRGKQLAIVRGVRDAKTGKVEQQILLTLYSKEEAQEAIGGTERLLQHLLRDHYPGVKLPWSKIKQGITEKMDILPERVERREPREHFREDLCALVRQLGHLDPQSLASAAEVIRKNAHELAFLRDLISWRLKCREANQDPNEFTRDPFGWRLTLEGRGIPMDVEEMASALYDRGKYKKARRVFQLLIDACGEGADCSNYLGLIALEEGKVEEACTHFQEAARIGRRSFPRKIAKKNFLSSLETRAYVRALRNHALALNQARRYEEALSACDRLEKECGDLITANAHRASVYLNTARFDLAFEAASFDREITSGESLVAALAAQELGRREDATASFLHAALNSRREVSLLLGEPDREPEDYDEQEEHNSGVYLYRSIRPYLSTKAGKRTVAFFRELKRSPAVAELLTEMQAVVRRWRGDNKTEGWRAAFERMTKMHTFAFAKAKASEPLPGEVCSRRRWRTTGLPSTWLRWPRLESVRRKSPRAGGEEHVRAAAHGAPALCPHRAHARVPRRRGPGAGEGTRPRARRGHVRHSASSRNIAVLDPLVGQTGWITCALLRVRSLETEEQVLFAGLSDSGGALDEGQCRRLFDLPGESGAEVAVPDDVRAALADALTRRRTELAATMTAKNGEWFDAEIEKLDRWAAAAFETSAKRRLHSAAHTGALLARGAAPLELLPAPEVRRLRHHSRRPPNRMGRARGRGELASTSRMKMSTSSTVSRR